MRGDEPALLAFERKNLMQAPYLLEEPRRAIVLAAIQSSANIADGNCSRRTYGKLTSTS
jgi:hypothetical protein